MYTNRRSIYGDLWTMLVFEYYSISLCTSQLHLSLSIEEKLMKIEN